jgi:PIN like domain
VNASVVWFTDRDLGKQFPRILTKAGLAVERHAELFRPTGSDEEWLRHCGENGRVAIDEALEDHHPARRPVPGGTFEERHPETRLAFAP